MIDTKTWKYCLSCGKTYIVGKTSWVRNSEGHIIGQVYFCQKCYDKHGNEHVHEYDENYKVNLSSKEKKRGGKVKKGYQQIVRYARMIGGHHLESYGEEGDYVRMPDDPAITKLKSVTTAYHFINQDYQSMVDRMESLEDFRDYVLTLMQKEITTSIGGVVEIDKSQIDKETYGVDAGTVDKVLHTLKAHKIVITNKADGYNRNPNLNGKPINTLDLSQQNFINSCIQTAAFLENEINRISGITDARQGQLGERALVRSSQMSIAQSSLMTTSLFTQFDRFEKRIIERWVELIALEWANNKESVEEVAARLNIDIPAIKLCRSMLLLRRNVESRCKLRKLGPSRKHKLKRMLTDSSNYRYKLGKLELKLMLIYRRPIEMHRH